MMDASGVSGVGVVGLGYVGLPLAVAFAQAGCDVIAVDLDPRKIDSIRDGIPTPEAAELTKLLENIFRSVNIALADQLAMLTDRMGIDIREVARAQRCGPAGEGSRIAVLGVSYKPGVGDIRESPALKIIELLRGQGALVSYHDSHVPALGDLGLTSVPFDDALTDTDLGLIVTARPRRRRHIDPRRSQAHRAVASGRRDRTGPAARAQGRARACARPRCSLAYSASGAGS